MPKITKDFRTNRKYACIGEGTIEYRPGQNAAVEVFLGMTEVTEDEPDSEVASIVIENKGASKAFVIDIDELIELAIKAGLFEEGETGDATTNTNKI